ncbi:MAG: BspA family leucine-rich repeat surface protein [Lachnospiraceae bacterium]|nr:BspA family leucine-rich repeat surface protein [Lachnospiraceae bacterium]
MKYNEQKPYIFISYAHKDSRIVFDIINNLIAAGYNVWWDDGIDPGTEWDENIAFHVKGCGYFVAFISENYIASKNCKDELNYSRDLDKNQLLVYLEDVKLPDGMAMRMNRIQSIYWEKYTDKQEAFIKLCSAKGIEVTKLSNESPTDWKPLKVSEAPTHPQSPGNKNMFPVIIGGVAVAVVIIIVALVLGGRGKNDSSGLPAEKTTTNVSEKNKSEDVVSVDDVTDEEESLEKTEVKSEGNGGSLGNDSSIGYKNLEEASGLSCFGSNITRGEINSIIFQSSLPQREEKGLDISAEGDGSVLAWFDKVSGGLYDLTIAADGKIRLPEDCSILFMGYTNARSIEFNEAVNAENVTTVWHMFSHDKLLRTLDVSVFADAKLKDMTSWFFENEALTHIDGLNKLDTSKVESFNCTFYYCKKLKEIDVSGFDTSSAKDMNYMFMYCSEVEELDVSGFDTSKTTSFIQLFAGCNSLKSLNVSGFNTSNVTDFRWMFAGDWSLDEIDLSGWTFANVGGDECLECLFRKMKPGVKIKIKENDLAILKSYESTFKDAPEDIEFIIE